ncbi:MAG TPA: hypothetical protein VFL91_08480 [Thermomicrobiales bacterium]|nr:hypothetical protein [Thermomicrobiales bacterium]
MATHGLGRIHHEDPRDAGFPLRAITAPPPPGRTARLWRAGALLNQGQAPRCVGYSWKNWRDALPYRRAVHLPPSADDIYAGAQSLDPWAGKPHDGSTVRAGAQYMQSKGIIASYHWAANLDDVVAYLLGTSPVVFGTNFYSGMMQPDPTGKVSISGSVVGGHAYLVCGANTETRLLTCFNSWGSWGDHGYFYMTFDDAARLLSEDGEACGALERK